MDIDELTWQPGETISHIIDKQNIFSDLTGAAAKHVNIEQKCH